ncbi:uncharacterized protein LOC126319982 [Schistocerca gregaria]|uniref:uncharacterized protein LOC126319982 n=1 Tax=Schistocerca gregaria TaxID=7010 RepID=UPI00211E0AE7|nr:uncharacterized protein LOC126319982 [Schistocerca gregaria]
MNLSDLGKDVLHVSFNQENTCLAVATETGFFVCDVNPLKLRFIRNFDEGIGIIEMLFRCNILALVGGGRRPKYPLNCVMLWDDHQEKKIAELEFRTDVKAVKMRKDCIIVALENKVYMYNFEDLRLLRQFDTCNATLGVVSMSLSHPVVLAIPSTTPGHVLIEKRNFAIMDSDRSEPTIIPVTQSPISQLELNQLGVKLAVTSMKGTVVRVIDLMTNTEERFRRGTTPAIIQCLAFSLDSSMLACTSNRGTVHIFQLDVEYKQNLALGSILKITGGDEKRAVIHFQIPEDNSICAFVPKGPEDDQSEDSKILVVLGGSGGYYKFKVFNENRKWKALELNKGSKLSYFDVS